MALSITFNICESSDCKSLIFTETTGAYSDPSNTGGWGTPNPATTDVTSDELVVLLPDDTSTYSFDLLAEGFPTTDSTVEFEITAADLGYGTGSLPDGMYTFTRTTIATTTYVTQVTKLFYCNTQCCVHQKLAAITDTECGCDDKKTKDALLAFTYLQALKDAAKCGNTSRFTKILKITTRMCNSSDCGCS
jgi:hypothetical protein